MKLKPQFNLQTRKEKISRRERIATLIILILILSLFSGNNKIAAYQIYQDNSVDADSDVDSVANKGTDAATSYLDAQSLDVTDQVITEENTGGGGGGSAQGDAIIFFGDIAANTPYSGYWDGSSWNTESAQTDIGNLPFEIKAVASPTNKDEVLVAIEDLGPDIDSWLYDNSTQTYTYLGQQATGLSEIKAGQPSKDFGIAYETSSGDKIIVYQDGTTTPKYRTMAAAASAWSTENSLTVSSTGTPYWVQLASDPDSTSNEIVLVYGDSNDDIYAQIWSGSAWGNEKQITLDGMVGDFAGGKQYGRVFSVAYEQTSGYAMVFYYTITSPAAYYYFWTGSYWDASSTAYTGEPTLSSTKGGWVELATDFSSSSDNIGITIGDGNGRKLYGDVWTGSSWDGGGAMKIITSSIDAGKGNHHDLEFETNSGDLMVVYTDRTAQGGYYHQWVSGTGWDASSTQLPSSPTLAMKSPTNVARDPSSNKLIAIIGEAKTNNIHYRWSWSGTDWTYDSTYNYDPSGSGKSNSWYVAYLDGSNGGSGTNYQLEWEHQVTTVDTNKVSYNLTIYGFSSDSESIEIQMWNSSDSTWQTALGTTIGTTEQWYNQSISGNGIITSTITYRFRGTTETSDTTQTTLNLDYSGIAAWNFSVDLIETTINLDPLRPDGQYYDIDENPIEVNVSSGQSFSIQIRGIDGAGNPVSNNWMWWDTDSNPTGSTQLTTSWVTVYQDQNPSESIFQIWIFLKVSFGTGDQTATMTLDIQIIT